MAKSKGFMLYHDKAEMIESLSDEDVGKLTKALMRYSRTGEMPKLEGALYAVFLLMYGQIDEDARKYTAKCEGNQAKMQKRWNDKKSDTDSIPSDTENIPRYTENIPRYTDGIPNDTESVPRYTKNKKQNTKNNVSSLSFGNNNTSFAIAHDVGDAADADAADDAVDAADLIDSAADNAASGEAEEDVKEPTARKETLQDRRFAEFWAEYPKKVAKNDAKRRWSKIKPDAQLFDAIMAGLRRAKVSEQWTKDHGRYIPNPATWLNGGRWEDDYSEVESGSSSFVVDEFYELAVNRSGHDP